MRTSEPGSKTEKENTPKVQPEQDKWILRLYIAGNTPKSITAFENLKKICKERL